MRPEIEAFLEREEGRRAESTVANRRNALQRYEEWLDETEEDPADVGAVGFEGFVDWLRGSRGVSDRTAYEYINHLWRLHQDLAKRDAGVEVPVKEDIVSACGLNLTETESEKHAPRSERSLSVEEMDLMVENAPDPSFKNGLMMKLMGCCGLRPRDMRDLRVRDVSDDYDWLEVRSSKTHSRRRVPIPDGLAQYLRLWLEHGYRDGCAYAEKTDRLVPGEYAERVGRRTVGQVVHEAAESAGLQEVLYEDANRNPRYRITPYSFRYGYGNHMKHHVDPERLAELMGHKNVTTTLKYYNAASEEELAEAGAVAPDPG